MHMPDAKRTWVTVAFSLVELIIVIAFMCILAVMMIALINPEELQKKARDAQRIKDAITLKGVLDQAQLEGISSSQIEEMQGVTSKYIPKDTSSCDQSNWLGFDICKFTASTPLDPLNGEMANIVDGADSTRLTLMYYQVKMNGADYEINVRQESPSNAQKVMDDGGDSAEWFEILSSNNNLFDEENILQK